MSSGATLTTWGQGTSLTFTRQTLKEFINIKISADSKKYWAGVQQVHCHHLLYMLSLLLQGASLALLTTLLVMMSLMVSLTG